MICLTPWHSYTNHSDSLIYICIWRERGAFLMRHTKKRLPMTPISLQLYCEDEIKYAHLTWISAISSFGIRFLSFWPKRRSTHKKLHSEDITILMCSSSSLNRWSLTDPSKGRWDGDGRHYSMEAYSRLGSFMVWKEGLRVSRESNELFETFRSNESRLMIRVGLLRCIRCWKKRRQEQHTLWVLRCIIVH